MWNWKFAESKAVVNEYHKMAVTSTWEKLILCLSVCVIDKAVIRWLCRYDHLRKEASDVRPAKVDAVAEPWRAALESSFANYVRNYYQKLGSITVYGTSTAEGNITLTACIESHQFSPKNYW